MLLQALQLQGFRNLVPTVLEPGTGFNVFIGDNGQGKTNLLEAVAMLALSSSPRSRRELELVGPVAPMTRIEASVESAGITAELAITLTMEGDRARRVIEVDGVRRRAFDSLVRARQPTGIQSCHRHQYRRTHCTKRLSRVRLRQGPGVLLHQDIGRYGVTGLSSGRGEC